MAIVLSGSSVSADSLSGIASLVLTKLGIISAGETPDDDDVTLVETVYDSVYAELRSRHLVDWGSEETVPTWAIVDLVEIVANRTANSYGLQRNAQEEELAMQKMAKHLAPDYAYEPVEADFY